MAKQLNLQIAPKQKKGKPFRKVGGKVGSIFGPMGNHLGKMAGSALGALFGSGDYSDHYINTVHTNSIINPTTNVPQVFSGVSGKGGIVVRRREYLTDIISSATANTFSSQTFPLNPGMAKTFPWLNNIAENFEQYRIRGMFFEFVSMSGDATASVATSLGYVAMATQYDALDPPLSSKMQLENYDMAQSCKPSRSQIHGIECKASSSTLVNLYLRNGDQIAGSDLRMYDFGVFNIATSAPGTSVNLGELWVSYDIELFKPRLPITIGGYIETLRISTSGITNGLNPMTGVGTVYTSGNLSVVLFVPGTRTLSWQTMPGAIWMVTLNWKGTAAVIVGPIATPISNIDNYIGYSGASLNVDAPQNGVTSERLHQQLFYKSSDSVNPGATAVFRIGNAGTIPTNSTLEIVVTQIDSTYK